MTKILFICNQNKNRSKTAETLFKNKFQTKSAGIYNQKPVNKRQLSWADVVLVMEDKQRQEIAKRFPAEYLQKRILSLDIPDIYDYGDPQLVKQLKTKVNKYADLLQP